MAKYKSYTNNQGVFVAIDLDNQIQPGTFEHTLAYLIDQEIDLSIFESRYHNDAGGGSCL